jgi:hypothetical protein
MAFKEILTDLRSGEARVGRTQDVAKRLQTGVVERRYDSHA